MFLIVLPKPESSEKSVGVIAGAAARRKLLQLPDVPSAEHYVVWFQRSNKMGYQIRDMPPPPAFAQSVQASLPHVAFESVFFVRQMTEFHRHDDAVHNHRRSQTRAEAQEQHLSALIAA